MVMINRATKEITFKIVYYGPGLCGKTTNLEYVYSSANPERRGKLLNVATETDRTLFFDFLPMELGTIRGLRVRVQLYTVPGQVFYDATRRIVLRGSDGVVFVADSQAIMMDGNVESVENLKVNLRLNGLDPETVPLVFQYNKQDLANLTPVETMDERLNWRRVPFFLSVATTGTGVNETLRKIIEEVIRNLASKDHTLRGAAAEKPAPSAPLEVEDFVEGVAPAGNHDDSDSGPVAVPAEDLPEEAPPMERTVPTPPRPPSPEVEEPVPVVAESAGVEEEDVEVLDLDALDDDGPPEVSFSGDSGVHEVRIAEEPEPADEAPEEAEEEEPEEDPAPAASPGPAPDAETLHELTLVRTALEDFSRRLEELLREADELTERLEALEIRFGG
jgi:signal recognition particle receptor subunit beta